LLLIRSADGEWQRDVVARTILEKAAEKWSERRDLNSRPPVPQSGNYCFSSVFATPTVTYGLYISNLSGEEPQNAWGILGCNLGCKAR